MLEYFAALEKLLPTTPPEDLRAYLRWSAPPEASTAVLGPGKRYRRFRGREVERERARVEHMWYTWSMSTKKPRVNVVLEPSAYDRLGELAKGSGESRSEIVRRFVGQMLDIVEDAELARLAVGRRKSLAGKKTLSHEAVWGSRRSASRSG